VKNQRNSRAAGFRWWSVGTRANGNWGVIASALLAKRGTVDRMERVKMAWNRRLPQTWVV